MSARMAGLLCMRKAQDRQSGLPHKRSAACQQVKAVLTLLLQKGRVLTQHSHHRLRYRQALCDNPLWCAVLPGRCLGLQPQTVHVAKCAAYGLSYKRADHSGLQGQEQGRRGQGAGKRQDAATTPARSQIEKAWVS